MPNINPIPFVGKEFFDKVKKMLPEDENDVEKLEEFLITLFEMDPRRALIIMACKTLDDLSEVSRNFQFDDESLEETERAMKSMIYSIVNGMLTALLSVRKAPADMDLKPLFDGSTPTHH